MGRTKSYFFCQVIKYRNYYNWKKGSKGEEVFSALYLPQVEAENSLFSFRYGESSGESKKLIAENVVGEVLVEVETTSPAAPTETKDQQACVDTSKLRTKKWT